MPVAASVMSMYWQLARGNVMTGSETREFFLECRKHPLLLKEVDNLCNWNLSSKLEQGCSDDSKIFYVCLEKFAESYEGSDYFNVSGFFAPLIAFNLFFSRLDPIWCVCEPKV